MLYNEFKPSDVAYFQKFFDLFTEKGIFDKKVVVADLIYKALSHGRHRHRRRRSAVGRAPRRSAPRRRRRRPWGALPAGRRAAAAVHRLGPRRCAAASSSRSCCRTPVDTLDDAGHRARRRPAAHRLRWSRCSARCEAFLIAAVIGVPLGVAARQQRARLPQRRVPDRLLPLDAVVGADPAVPADLRRLRHQQGRDRRVRRVPDRRVQQRLRRHQRAQAARDGGQGDGRVALADLQATC